MRGSVAMCSTQINPDIFTRILKEELVPAMGCTEPIALAFAGAKAREVLGTLPDKIIVEASGSIIKNVKSVVVPNTGNLKGIPAAVSAGVTLGNPDKKLEVLSDIKESEIPKISEFLNSAEIEVIHLKSSFNFDIILTAYKGEDYAKVRITNAHTNITLIEKNGEKLLERKIRCESDEGFTDRSTLSGEAIWEYIRNVSIHDIRPILKRQIEYNSAIAEEGLRNDYGASIGKVILTAYGDNVRDRAKAMAAAGSDARMNGCELPVIINSGSGNQGMTCSLPVLEYAKELKADEDKLYRALALSNLIAIHIKSGIGRLSAYCGAVSAGAAAGAGIAYLYTEDYSTVMHTVVNALSIVSGIICDGAKASCAAKIASSVDAGILGFEMYRQGREFVSGDGIVAKGFEANVKNIGRLGKTGMKTTDAEILDMMLDT